MPNILNLRKEQNTPQEQPQPVIAQKAEKEIEKPKHEEPAEPASGNEISWSVPEYEKFEKSTTWFVTSGVIAALIAGWAIWTHNYPFALIIGLSYFAVIAYGVRDPQIVKLTITPLGIKIANQLYEYSNLKSFWIFYEPPMIKELSIKSKKLIMPYIKVPLGNQDPVALREFLINYLPERKHKESAIDNVSKQLKF